MSGQVKNHDHPTRIRMSIRFRLAILAIILLIPLTSITVFLLYTLNDISDTYDSLVKNVTAASEYSPAFKEEIDGTLYQMVARNLNKSEVDSVGFSNPDVLIKAAREDFKSLQNTSGSKDAAEQCRSVLKLLDNLQQRVDDIDAKVKLSGSYDENMTSLDNDIRILTELIQEKVAGYIYFESANMEEMRLEMDARRNQIMNVSIGVLAGVLLLSGVISIEISRSITIPVEQLVSATEKLGKGEFGIHTDTKAGSELAILNDAFNTMSSQIAGLVEQIKADEARVRTLELKLLQEQINPHFLYNTLDNILWLAEDERKEDVEAIVTSLSHFFRTGLSGGHDAIRLEEEVSHVRSYLEIQQFRYRDILSYDINVPDTYSDNQILRMTLQPIVENALYHGIKKKRGMGCISIFAREEGEDLVLSVADDGIGMTEDELSRVRALADGVESPGEDNSGFGLANVAERLRLFYGDRYGLRFSSDPGKGTTVEIVIPRN